MFAKVDRPLPIARSTRNTIARTLAMIKDVRTIRNPPRPPLMNNIVFDDVPGSGISYLRNVCRNSMLVEALEQSVPWWIKPACACTFRNQPRHESPAF